MKVYFVSVDSLYPSENKVFKSLTKAKAWLEEQVNNPDAHFEDNEGDIWDYFDGEGKHLASVTICDVIE